MGESRRYPCRFPAQSGPSLLPELVYLHVNNRLKQPAKGTWTAGNATRLDCDNVLTHLVMSAQMQI